MEGVIDLIAAFGQLPATIYIASAAYATANGGALVAPAPAGNAIVIVESAEFLALPQTASVTYAGAAGRVGRFSLVIPEP